ncbi:tetratricopeptide repeat family protein [Ralstonia insidiosa]|uniref:Tetratricopeptide repeat family protein n=1 Tax=Ralstonia insidiosa TaxID=190721 RepID=A0AAC9BCI2_9RALS|nr:MULTISPECIES: tetratricopeptide repeat protein [Ralstonia]ANH71333.1 tetratricopeptide repeat family protein [Ralstonia insidiosa]EPX94898.1 hypothetical protein C404_26690 [Ralstonia sp. AU12-08]MBY4708383.1 tetratricopeptide repeat protein [Ralstonia insidiosa]GAQ28227.1 hypothetical protein SAMD00023378_1910 [Ralstonia sp. NT80]
MSDANPFHKQKIFLSYAHKVDDNPDHTADLVEAIQQRLEAAGHEAWIDRQQLHPGKDWREGITRGIDESDRVLSFLSPRSVRDPGVCLDEIGIAMSHKHGAIATLLADKRVENKIPASVAHIQYLDVSDWSSQRERGPVAWGAWLDTTVKKILAIIAANEGFAGEIQALQQILSPMPESAKLGKLIEDGLVGRQWVKAAIAQWRTGKLEQRMFWLVGEPGMGKSALAAELVHKAKLEVVAYHFCDYQVPESRTAHTFVCNLAFLLATRLPDYRRLLRGNLSSLPRPVPEMAATELMERLLIHPLRNRIDGGVSSDRLVVLIDALDEAEPELVNLLARYLDAMPRWLGLVVTSRPDVKMALARYPAFEMTMRDPRNEADLQAYLNDWQQSDPDAPLDAQTRSTLIAASQGNMLYLALAREGYANGLFSLCNPAQLPQGLGAVYLEWMRRQFGADPHGDPAWSAHCYPLLALLCATPEPLPLSLAGTLLQWKGQDRVLAVRPLGSLVKQEGDAWRLCHRSLGEWLSDADQFHECWVNLSEARLALVQGLLPMIPDALKADTPQYLHRAFPILLQGLEPDQSASLLGASAQITLGLLEQLSDFWERYPHTQAWRLQVQLLSWVIEQRDRLDGHGGLERSISRYKLGNVLFSQGAYAQSVEQLRQAYSLCVEALGTHHAQTLAAQRSLARALYGQGRYADAAALQEQELRLRASEPVVDALEVLSTKSNLARSLYASGRYAQAKALHQQVFDEQCRALGPQDPRTVSSMSALASALFALGDNEEAETLNTQVLDFFTRFCGAEHPRTLTSASYLASTLFTQGQFERAEALQETVLASRQRILGEAHPDTLLATGQLALTRRALGHLLPAQQMQQDLVQVMSEVLGANHPSTLFQQCFLADTCFDLGEDELAMEIQKRVVAQRMQVLGAVHPDTLVAEAGLALTLARTGLLEPAQSMLARVADTMRQSLGGAHPDTVFSLRLLLKVLTLREDEAGGRAILQQLDALEPAQKVKRPVHFTNTWLMAGWLG